MSYLLLCINFQREVLYSAKEKKMNQEIINVNLHALNKLYKATDRIASDMSKPIIKFEEINKHFSESDRKK